MENHHHSSILNSKRYLLYILGIVLCCVLFIEAIYILEKAPIDHGILDNQSINSDPKPKIVIIGDCRALYGIASDSLVVLFKNYSVYNLAKENGDINSQLLKVHDIAHCDYVIAGVNPGTTFGGGADYLLDEIRKERKSTVKTRLKDLIFFQKGRDLYLTYRKYFIRPYETLDSFLSDVLKSNFRFTYGFMGISDLILSGKISYSVTSGGWVRYLIYGSDRVYGRVLNHYIYKNRLLISRDKVIQCSKTSLEANIMSLRQTCKNLIFVRIPVSEEMLALEDATFPWFDAYFDSISKRNDCRYLYQFPQFKYPSSGNDGSHLQYPDAVEFSKILAKNLLINDN